MTTDDGWDQSARVTAEVAADVQAFADALPAIAIVIDAAARLMLVNQRLVTFGDLDADNLTGRGFAELLHPEEMAAFELAWRQSVATSEPFEIEHRLKNRHGDWCWFLCRAAPYPRPASPALWIAICTEIEDQKFAELQLARSEAWYRSTFDHGAVGIAHLSRDGVILDVNKRLGSMLMRERAALVGTQFSALCHPADAGITQSAILSLLEGGQDHFVSTRRYLKSDGRPIWGYLTVSAERDGKGELTHFVAFIEDVTAHKARQDRLEQTLAVSGAVGWEWHPATDEFIHTGDVHGIFGRQVETVQQFFDSIVPEDRGAVIAAAQAIVADGQSYELEFRIAKPDGEICWVRDQGHRLFVDGQVGAVGLLRDITAERLARDALQEREERLRLAFDASRTSAWDWSIGTGEVVWSEGLAAYLDLGVEGFGGTFDAFWALVYPDDKPYLEQELQAALAGIRDYVVEFRMVRPDGSLRWTSTRGMVVRDGDGRPVRMVGVDSDITDRKNAESDAIASEAQLRTMIDALPQMVWTTLPDGRPDFYNSRYYEFTGVSPGSADGDQWVAVFHPDDQQRSAKRWGHSIATSEPYEIEYRLRHHSGDYRWVLGRALPVRNGDGEIVRWLGTCTDIHEMVEVREALAESRAALDDARRNLEQKVEQRTAELITANQRLREENARRQAARAALVHSQKLEALGQLVSGVSHDFNNVVQAVAGGYGLIARRSSDPVIIDIASHGVRAAERGGRLVKELLAVARQQSPDLQAIDPCQVLAEAEPLLARSAGDKVAVVIDCPPDLPLIRIDEALLETALINLAVNARDAMPDGGRLTITVVECPVTDSHRPPELEGRPALVLSITDTGSGMAPKVLQRVVEPFFTTKGQGRGTGLGLAMVAAFVRQAGGAFRIESTPGVGTTVSLYLQVATGPLPAAAPQGNQAVAALAGLSVLLVEDDHEVRAVVAAQLAEMGHKVAQATTARDALAMLADEAVDLVLTDVVMPDMDGVALIATVHALAPQLPVVFMTGHPEQNGLERFIVLAKPFSSEGLHDALVEAMNEVQSGLLRLGPEVAGLATRVQSPAARDLLTRWGEVAAKRLPPLLEEFDRKDFERQVILVRVDQSRVPMAFHLVEADQELEVALGSPLAGTDVPVVGDESPAAREQAFRRCARSGRPAYDYVRLNLGDGQTQLFERLLLPFASDGAAVDSIIAVVDLRTVPTDTLARPPMPAGSNVVDYHAPDLARQVEALPTTQVDDLPFGAIKLDPAGKVVFYSKAERRLSGSGSRQRLDRYFFVEIAPCMDTPSYRGRIEQARAAGHLDLEFSHIGDFVDGHREVTVRVQSSNDGGCWIFMRRDS